MYLQSCNSDRNKTSHIDIYIHLRSCCTSRRSYKDLGHNSCLKKRETRFGTQDYICGKYSRPTWTVSKTYNQWLFVAKHSDQQLMAVNVWDIPRG